MKKLTMLLSIFLSIFIAVPSVVFATNYTVSINDVPIAEGGGTAAFSVSLNTAIADGDTVTVDFITSSGTALAGSDFNTTSGTLSFDTNGDQTKPINVTILNDTIVEPDETFIVDLSNLNITTTVGSTVVFADNQGEGTITNDDLYHISIINNGVDEGVDAEIRVELDQPVISGDSVLVDYVTEDSTAEAPGDYTAHTTTTLNFTPGESTKTINVVTFVDTIVENTEFFNVNLSNASANATIDDNQGSGIITDNDKFGITVDDPSATEGSDVTFTITVDVARSKNVVVTCTTANGTATLADSDYTQHAGTNVTIPSGPAGQTHTFPVATGDDNKVERDETFSLTVDSGDTDFNGTPDTGTGTINNNDTATLSIDNVTQAEGSGGGSTNFVFTVSLDNAVQDGFDVAYTTNDGSAVAGSDYTDNDASLTFTGTAGETQNITVVVAADDVVEADETFTVVLGTVTPAGAGVDAADITTGATGTGTIISDDEYSISISGSPSVVEGNQASFSVSVTPTVQTGDTVTVQYSTADGSAVAPGDYGTETNTLLTFGEGESIKNATVDTIDDAVVENSETFTVTLNSPTTTTGSVSVVDGGPKTGTITDNDEYSISISGSPSVVEGNQASFSVTVTPTVQTGDTVTVQYSTTNGSAAAPGDYTAETNTVVTFNVGDSTLNATVDTIDDAIVENDETFTVTINSPTTSTGSVSIADHGPKTGTIQDNGDTYNVSITNIVPNPVAEADTTVTITVELGNVDVNGVIGTVNVDYATSESGANPATHDVDYTETSGTLTFTSATGPTLAVGVPIINDDLLESDETFDFTLSGGVSITGTNPVTVTINDDTDKCGISIDGPYTVTEGSSITFNVSINQVVPADQTVTVQYETTDDTAVAEGDYGAISLSTLTFNEGQGPLDSQQITVNTNDDSLYEIPEHFTVDLSSPSDNAAIIVGQGGGYIDDDGDKFDVSIEAAETVTEGTGATVTFTVTLDQEVPGGTSVSFTLDDVTAVLGSDYSENTPGPTLNFAAGETTKDIVVNIIDDDLYEVPETFEINITCADPNSTPSNGKGTCTINDDGDTYIVSISAVPVPNPVLEANTTVTFTVTLDQEVPGGALVDFSLNDVTAALGSDYSENTASPLNFAAGETTKDIIVNIINDQVDEDSETFEVIITTLDPNAILGNDTGSCTITDNDYTVTFNIATVGPEGFDGGTVNGAFSLDQVVDHGTDCVPVTAAPNVGYRFVEWTGDYNGTVNPLTITNVTSDMTITANFIAFYTITATVTDVIGDGIGGIITPSGAVIVDYGTDQKFIFDPDTCYEVDDVVVDLSSIGGEIREYTFSYVTADHGIDVEFYHYDCTITATAESGGTISPSGSIVVNCAGSQDFTITAGTDNEIEEVLVDGLAQAVPPNSTTYPYTFTNVKKGDEDTSPCVHYIVAKFTRQPLSCMDIFDVPLNALSRSAPANIMFVLDDSGSMDWEFITDESNGLFSGNYYVFNDPGDNEYSGHILGHGGDRSRWKSQWSGYNRMYYDPNVEYKPWPTLSDADSDSPRAHPMNAGNTLELHGFYDSVDDGIVIDNLDGAPTFTTPTGTWGESGASPEYNGSSYYSDNAGATATWTPNLPAAGSYEVWIYWASRSEWDRDASAQYTIHDTSGDNVFVKDQRVDYGQWNLMGTFNFTAGTSGYVTLTRGAGGATSADAVKFIATAGGGTSIIIRNAHYYVWSAEGKPYLVHVDGGAIEYYEVNDDGDDIIEYGELTLTDPPPDDVIPKNESGTPRSYADERKNFANWFSFYRKRELTATAAVANVINNMQGVQIGLKGINGYDSNIVQEVHKIKVGAVDQTTTLLNKLYSYRCRAYGTPLRRGLQAVGQYFDQDDGGENGGIGSSPYATEAEGGNCQQTFAIVMTDGYWNGCDPAGLGNEDGDQGVPYADSYGSDCTTDCNCVNCPSNNCTSCGISSNPDPPTLADVAMYYYKTDLSSTLDPEVPINGWDDNEEQHMVTYGVSFGVTGTLVPSAFNFIDTFPTWPNPQSGNRQKIDDLWHASVNGRGLFLSASNPNELVNQLLAIMQNIEDRAGSASSVSVNGDELYTKLSGDGEILMFQSSYDTVNWTGNVNAYKVCTSLTGDCADKQIGDLIKTPSVWSANDKVESQDWNTGRKIVTYNGTDAGKIFRWGDLTLDQQTALNNEPTLFYLRGDTTNEKANGGSFRDRAARLGDIVHSSPTFEDGVLYAGGNDGMLHAFAATDDAPYAGAVGGEELFAYVPNLVFNNLSQLADPAYTHKYFVDLTPTVKSGVNIGTEATPDLITLLVGGLGKGGKGYYALDVTDPTSWSTESDVAGKVMWEYPNSAVPAADTDDLGYSYSRPAIVKCNDPDVGWIVIFGNGYNSQNGHAVLFILEPSNHDNDGDFTHLLMKIDTGVGGCNGLSTPVPVDVNYDKKVDYVYAGDLRGNVWKFDLTDTDYTKWKVAFNDGTDVQPLFQAQGPGGTTQPVTTMPDVMYHPSEHGYMVLFNTGKYLGESDILDITVQSFYGIWDYGDDGDDDEYLGAFNRGAGHELSKQPITVTLLAQEVIPSESDPNEPDFWTVTINEGEIDEYDLLLRLTTDYDIVWETVSDIDGIPGPNPLDDLSNADDNHAGWYFDLPLSGERGTVDVMIRDGNVIAISFKPDDTPCSCGGFSVIHEMSAASGARLSRPQFDINGDGVIDDDDMINIGTALNPIWVVPTGIMGLGEHTPPAILIDPDSGVETKYFSTSKGDIKMVKEKAARLGICYWKEFE